MVPRCTQALDKCKCVSWAHRHQWDCLAAAQIRQNWHFYCLPMPSFICQRRSLTPQRDVGPFSSPVNVATAYRTQWVFTPHSSQSRLPARCVVQLYTGRLNGSDSTVLPSEAHVKFQPKPDWLHLSTKAVQSIYWNPGSEWFRGREEQSLNTFDVVLLDPLNFVYLRSKSSCWPPVSGWSSSRESSLSKRFCCCYFSRQNGPMWSPVTVYQWLVLLYLAV